MQFTIHTATQGPPAIAIVAGDSGCLNAADRSEIAADDQVVVGGEFGRPDFAIGTVTEAVESGAIPANQIVGVKGVASEAEFLEISAEDEMAVRQDFKRPYQSADRWMWNSIDPCAAIPAHQFIVHEIAHDTALGCRQHVTVRSQTQSENTRAGFVEPCKAQFLISSGNFRAHRMDHFRRQ